jgi:hypothetical protein
LEDEKLTAMLAPTGMMTAIARTIHAARGMALLLALELPIQITATTAAVTNAPRAKPDDTFVAASNTDFHTSGPAAASDVMHAPPVFG